MLGFIGVLALAAIGQTADLEERYEYSQTRFSYSQVHMGVAVNLTLYAESETKAEEAARAAFARFAQLDAIMSDYRKDSELNLLCAKAGQGPVKVSEDLFRVLARSQEVARWSDGAFDITVSPIVRLWRDVRRSGQLPYRSRVLEIRKLVNWRNLVLNAKARTAELKVPGMQLDLGGIAKGDGDDQAMKVLRSKGISSALIEAGGDIVVSDPPPGQKAWVISVRNWKEPLFLANAAVSTSGDSEQFVEIGGRRFSHIIDPRTGYALTNSPQVTIVAKDGLTTDPLSTAISVLGMEKGFALAERYGARAVFAGG